MGCQDLVGLNSIIVHPGYWSFGCFCEKVTGISHNGLMSILSTASLRPRRLLRIWGLMQVSADIRAVEAAEQVKQFYHPYSARRP